MATKSDFIVKSGLKVTTDATVSGNVTATAFSGNGVNITSVNAATVGSNTASDLRSYSDTIAGTAYSNATSYAATIAGTAYSNAVSTASTDATSKAATAYSNATSYAATIAGTAYSNATSYASNASNISSGTLAEARLPYRMNQNVRTSDSVEFAGMTLTGNLVVSGNVNIIGANNLSISDNMIYLNSNNDVSNPDLGFAGNYNDGTYAHAGFFRDATDGVWKVFDGYTPEPDASVYIDTSNTTFRIANFQANVITAASFSGNGSLVTSVNAATVGGNTAATLRSYSDTIAGTAYTNATSYAATIAATAYSNAVSTASADATSKAATAYSNATSYAATIAGTAYSNATSYAATIAGTAYSNAVSYAASNTYVNSTFAPKANPTFTGNATFDTSTLFVDGTNDRVGIGTSSPSSLLHLSTTGPAILTIEADTDNITETDNARIVLKQDGGNVNARIGYANNTNVLEIINEFADSLYLGTSNATKLTIDSSGNVGIGVSPGYKLDVNGNAMVRGTIYMTNTNGVVSSGDGSGWAFSGSGYVYLAQSGNTYSQSRIVARSGISDDTNAALTLYGGTSGYTQINGSARSPIFYDSDNTSYYVDPSSSSVLYGSLTVSAGNATGGGIILADDGDIVDLNTGYAAMRFSSGVKIYSANKGGSSVITLGSDGIGTASSWRAPIFYDSDNTGYYVDPASTSNLSGLTVGGISFASDVWYGNNGLGALNNSSNMNSLNKKSGVYFYDNPTNGPFGTWTTWLQATSHYSGDNYGWQFAKSYWGEDWSVRALVSNAWGSWRRLALYNINYAAPLYANVFYDADNTAYYCDMNNTSSFNAITAVYYNGLLDVRGTGLSAGVRFYNSSYGRDYRLLQKDDGRLVFTDESAGAERITMTTGGSVTINVDTRSPIFYDSNDTSVYLDAGTLVLRNASPTIYFRDTDNNSAMIHNNSSLLYILRGGNDTMTWTAVNSQWPAYWNLTNNDVTMGGSIYAIGNITAYASDVRLKENIIEIPNAIDKIKQIRGVTFDWKDKAEELGFAPETKHNDLGVIAQEIQAVLPQAVKPAPFDVWAPDPKVKYSVEELAEKTGKSKSGENYLTVNLEKIVPLLIEGIKEQQKQIEDLRNEINTLKGVN